MTVWGRAENAWPAAANALYHSTEGSATVIQVLAIFLMQFASLQVK